MIDISERNLISLLFFLIIFFYFYYYSFFFLFSFLFRRVLVTGKVILSAYFGLNIDLCIWMDLIWRGNFCGSCILLCDCIVTI